MSRSSTNKIEDGPKKRESYTVTVKRIGDTDGIDTHGSLEITVEFQDRSGSYSAEIAISRGIAPKFHYVEDPSRENVADEVCRHIRAFLMSFEG